MLRCEGFNLRPLQMTQHPAALLFMVHEGVLCRQCDGMGNEDAIVMQPSKAVPDEVAVTDAAADEYGVWRIVSGTASGRISFDEGQTARNAPLVGMKGDGITQLSLSLNGDGAIAPMGAQPFNGDAATASPDIPQCAALKGTQCHQCKGAGDEFGGGVLCEMVIMHAQSRRQGLIVTMASECHDVTLMA